MKTKNRQPDQSIQDNDFEQAVHHLCEKALNDAKNQLHPLLQNVELDRLDKRNEFIQAFRMALEQRVARTLATWQPSIRAVFKFDETRSNAETWDSSVHLLVMVSTLSNKLKAIGELLDQNLVKHLQQLGWSRFEESRSILDVQQVTTNEVRRGISYGAMFCAVYSIPVKVWPVG